MVSAQPLYADVTSTVPVEVTVSRMPKGLLLLGLNQDAILQPLRRSSPLPAKGGDRLEITRSDDWCREPPDGFDFVSLLFLNNLHSAVLTSPGRL